MQNKEQDHTSMSALTILMIIAPFFIGLAPDGWALLFTALLTGILIYLINTNKKITLLKSKSLYGYLLILIGSCLSIFTSISKGDAVIGIIRVLSVGIWILITMQYEETERENALDYIPSVSILMLVVSAIIYVIPDLRWFVSNGNGRMAGFFQYANTFALYLLLSMIIYAKRGMKEDGTVKGTIYLFILAAGILWSGSRFTLVLLACVLLIESITDKDIRIPYLIILITGIAVILILSLTGITGNPLTRIFTATQSTLYGRFIYWEDALTQIKSHPLGLGYKGFSIIEPAVQTAPYIVRFVHNDFLQGMVDYGWIAGIGMVFMAVTMIFHAKKEYRAAIIVLVIHALFDFDLQFMVICWVGMLMIPYEGKKEIESTIPVTVLSIVLTCLYVWTGIGYLSYDMGHYDTAYKIYPFSEEIERNLMAKTADQNLAEDIIKKDTLSGVSYDVLANTDKDNEEYISMLKNKRQALLLQRYDMDHYKDYVDMLMETEDALSDDEEYRKMVQEVPELMDKAEKEMNPLIYKTVDAPSFKLSEKQRKFVEKYN